ncbi:hypothetical protein Ancab_022702 [Ancistrocladus abbreviatus]
MAFAATKQYYSSIAPCNSPSFFNKTLLAGHRVHRVFMPRLPLSTPFLCFSRRRRGNTADRLITTTPPSKKKKSHQKHDTTSEEGLDEDAVEALFKQLEEDLKNDDGSLDDSDDEITEEELAMLEQELEEALAEDEDLSELLNAKTDDAEGGQGEEQAEELKEVEEEDEDEEKPLKLKGWQLRRLAYALKAGRRKTGIKSLAAEVCLDRAVVLELLRNPPPNLLMMSAALPDKKEPEPEPEPVFLMPLAEEPKPTISNLETEDTQSVSCDMTMKSAESETRVKPPIHVLQSSWSAQKRLKKVQVDTLERVYRRTKRPTNAMISSIIQVTNLPRKRIVKWFEDKRAEEGVPAHRQPYQRATSETVFMQ